MRMGSLERNTLIAGIVVATLLIFTVVKAQSQDWVLFDTSDPISIRTFMEKVVRAERISTSPATNTARVDRCRSQGAIYVGGWRLYRMVRVRGVYTPTPWLCTDPDASQDYVRDLCAMIDLKPTFLHDTMLTCGRTT